MSVRKRHQNWRLGLECLEDRQLLSLAALTATNVSATAGQPFTGTVATLIDTNLGARPSDFSAVINWGTGQNQTPGQVVGTGIPGVFLIDGTNTYASGGTFRTQISVTDTSGESASTSGSATIAAPGLTITANAVTGTAGQSLMGVTVASFIDPNSADFAGEFSALIQWGNGASSIGTVSGGPNTFTVTGPATGSITYASPGTYATTVTVVGTGSVPGGSAHGTAVIAAPTSASAMLSPQSIFSTAGVNLQNVVVANFTDPGTTYPANQISTVISWGDGQTTPGTPTGQSGKFSITGTHTYGVPGVFTVAVTLTTPEGTTFSSSSTATVLNPNINNSFTGDLAAFPANGPNTVGGFSTTNRPLFSGTAAPFSTVELFARPVNIDVNEPLGYAIASSSGQWSLATGPLADGSYTVTAVVTPPGGYPSLPQPVGNNGSVVIDTKPPRVVRVDYSGGKQVTVFFSDSISGMNLSSLSQASNYTLAGPRFAGLHPSHVSLLAAGSPTNVQQVVLTLSAGRKTRSSIRALSIAGTNISNGPAGSNVGIADNAGNPLPAFSQGFASSATRLAGRRYRKARV